MIGGAFNVPCRADGRRQALQALQQRVAVHGDIRYCEIIEDGEKRPQRPLKPSREITEPLKWTGVGFGIEALDQFKRRFGPSDNLANSDLFGWPGETHASPTSPNGLDIAALTKVVSNLDQMRLRYPVRTSNLAHGHKLGRVERGELKYSEGKIRVLSQSQCLSSRQKSSIHDIVF